MPMNVIVTCEGKQCGLSVCVVINPVTNEMTHFVVRDLIRRHIERLVPIKFVTSSNHEEITLNCTHEQWRNLQPFEETDFIKVEVPHVRSYGYGWPYVETMYETVDAPVTSRNIPPYSRDVRRGAKVMATDGSIGHIEEFVYDAKTFCITHIVLAKGHLWNEQDIVIPVESIDDFTEEHIRLTIDKAAVDKLPVVPIHRQVTVV